MTYRSCRAFLRHALKYFRVLILMLALAGLINLLLYPPLLIIKECPNIYGDEQYPPLVGQYIQHSIDTVDCAAVIAGNIEEITKGSRYASCSSRNPISNEKYISITENCDSFIQTRKYITKADEEEAIFPIAYSILMFESVEQTERLLRAIYRPQNTYCIHVDSKSKDIIHQSMKAIADCFDNVFIASTLIDVEWAWFPVLEAEIICMKDLLQRSKTWRYFINLTGREFPLRTNLELVRILKGYQGGNDVDGTLWRRPIVWTKYHWRNENWQSWREKEPAPHGFNIAKGSTHIAVTRGFVQFAVYNQKAIDLLDWMRDIRSPDEHFFPTLNHNPQLGVPGAYTENPDLKHFLTRYKVWETVSEKCAGRWFRFICNFGVGDLTRLTQAPELFSNKFRYEFEPIAFNCMEQWYLNRTHGVGPEFNLTFYTGQPWVKHHRV